MAQDAHEAPVGRGRSSTPPGTGMWASPPRQMQTRAPLPTWSPYAGKFDDGAGTTFAAARFSPAAAGYSRLPSEHALDHAWNKSAPTVGAHECSGYRENFLWLLEARNVEPEMFDEDVAAAAASSMAGAAAYGLGSVDLQPGAAAGSVPPARHVTASSPLVYSGSGSSVGCAPCYDHEVKGGSQQQVFGAPTAAFLQQMIPSCMGIQSALGLGCSSMGSETERLAESSFAVGNLPDAGSFIEYRPAAEFMSSNNSRREQWMGSSSSASGADSVASLATTRRKSEHMVGGNAKRSKQKAPHKASPPKPQAPKVKLGEKITALQQIVSPFGKTDTSSVLFETIEYINFLHEQLRLFSEPYMTKSACKGHIQFGDEEKVEKRGTGHGLRGRGLCLVPVSLTSQVYHDDALPDYWTPAYRSCLYG